MLYSKGKYQEFVLKALKKTISVLKVLKTK